MREGWICPSCKRGVAPTEKYCDHGGIASMRVYPAHSPHPSTLPNWPTTTIGGGTFSTPVDPNIILMNLGH